MSNKRAIKGTALLSLGGVVTAACGFARNIIVARLISVEDFGIASTFAMTMSLIEMASNLALDRMLVQAPDGDDERMLATAHAFQVFRGAIAAAVLFVAAGFVADLFDVPEVTWAFRVIAAVPLIRALGHLDIARLQRSMRYRPLVLTETVPQIASIAAAGLVAIWLRDYRVMLWVVLVQVGVAVLISHLVAERPYRWAWDRAIIRRMIAFGWPLLIDGGLIFAAFHGEKVIVGSAYSVEQLGWYSAAVTLAMAPSLLATTVLSRLVLPGLSARQGDHESFRDRYTLTSSLYLLAGAVFAVGMTLGGGPMLVLLFGEKYADAVAVMPWLSIAFGLRIARNAQAICAVSLGRTQIALIGNLVRAGGVLVALLFLWQGRSITWIAASALIGEAAAYLASVALVGARLGLVLPVLHRMIVLSMVPIIGAVFLVRSALWTDLNGVVAVGLSCVAGALVAGCLGLISPILRAQAIDFLRLRTDTGGVEPRNHAPAETEKS
jgi:O-antigen/teichoic acid export membrane protein